MANKAQAQWTNPIEIQLNEYMHNTIANGEYIDAQRYVKMLPENDKINILRLPSFRAIQNLNKVIDSSIDAYWFSNYVRVFEDIEEYVTSNVSKYKHKDYTTFDAIGMGTLRMHPELLKKFKVDRIIPPPRRVTIQELLECGQDFLRAEKIFDVRTMDEPKARKFELFRRKRFPDSYWSFDFDLKTLISISSKSMSLHKKARIDLENFLDKRWKDCLVAFDLKYTPSSSESALNIHSEAMIRTLGIDLSMIFLSIHHLVREVKNSSYEAICMSILGNASVSCIFGGKENTKTFRVGNDVYNKVFTENTEDVKFILTPSEKFGDVKNCLIEGFTAFCLCELFTHHANKAKNKKDVDGMFVAQYLAKHQEKDIPVAALMALDLVFRKAIRNQLAERGGGGEEDDQGFAAVNKYDFEVQIRAQKLFETLKRCFEGPIINANIMMALLTGTILFYRSRQISNIPADTDILPRIPSVLPESVTTVCADETFKSMAYPLNVMRALCQIESTILEDTRVPAFECLRLGNFNHYMAEAYPDLVGKIFTEYAPNVPIGSTTVSSASASSTLALPNQDFVIPPETILSQLCALLTADSELVGDSDIDRLRDLELSLITQCDVDSFDRLMPGCTFLHFLTAALHSDDYDSLQSTEDFRVLFFKRFQGSYEGVANIKGEVEESVHDEYSCALMTYSASQLLALHNSDFNLVTTALMKSFGSTSTESAKIISSASSSIDISKNRVRDWRLLFPLSNECNTDEHVPKIENIRGIAVDILLATPLGSSCALFSNWDEVFSLEVQPGRRTTVAEFVLMESALFTEKSPELYFLFVTNGDCVPLHLQEFSLVETLAVVKAEDWSSLSGWCISSFMLVGADRGESVMVIKQTLLTLSEESGGDPLQRLCEISLHIIMSTHVSLRQQVLVSLIDLIAKIRKLTSKSVQQALIAAANNSDSLPLETDRALMLLGLKYPAMFPSFRFIQLRRFKGRLQTGTAMPTAGDVYSTGSGIQTSPINSTEIFAVNSVAISASSSGNDLNPTESKHAVVNTILRNQFGYTDEGRPSNENPDRIRLKGLLEHVSTKLYSSDVHFVLELIQNADDNTYLDGIIPTLKFELYPLVVVVSNNEKGFQDDNIAAICDVNRSTKKGKKDYIGQKGIGFKSVFTVSNLPEIHSNGFHIRFNRDDFMLEPIWIDENAEKNWPSKVDEEGRYFETCLRLVLDDKIKRNMARLIQNVEEVVNDKLLIFLKHLSRVEVHDRVSERDMIHSRVVLGSSWMQLTAGYYGNYHLPSNISYWHVRRHSWRPELTRSEVIVDSTEIAIAIPFIEVTTKDSASLPKLRIDSQSGILQPIYAFLPTNATVFPFILQGDFVLATSRESLLEDDEWNQHLCRKVPELFISTIKEMLSWINEGDKGLLSELSGRFDVEISIDDIVRLIPSVAHTSRLYRDITEQIFASIRNVCFLRSIDGDICCPDDLMLAGSFGDDVLNLVPTSLLQQVSGRKLLHSEIRLQDEVAAALKMPSFSVDILLRCMESYAASVDEGSTEYSVETIARFCIALDALLRSRNNPHGSIAGKTAATRPLAPRGGQIPSQVILKAPTSIGTAMRSDETDRLRKLSIWQLEGGKIVSLEDGNILIRSTKASTAQTMNQKECISLFTEHIRLLGSVMRDAADSIVPNGGNRVAQFLLDNLKPPRRVSEGKFAGGFEDFIADHIIKSVILPCYSNPDVSTLLSREISSAFLAYIFLSGGLQKLSVGENGNEISRAVKEYGVSVPTMVCSESTRGVKWKVDGNKTVMRYSLIGPDIESLREVHLGVEFPDSATNCLVPTLPTASRQLKWTIVDPMVAALAFGTSSDDIKRILSVLSTTTSRNDFTINDHTELVKLLSLKPSVLKDWKAFLLRIGVVDLFGLYTIENDLQAPSLFQMMRHVLRNSEVVGESTAVASNHDEDIGFTVANTASSSASLMFLPRADSSNHLIESKNVFHFFQTLFKAIVMELSTLVASDSNFRLEKSKFISDLNNSSWVPVQFLGDKLDDRMCISCPRNVFLFHGEEDATTRVLRCTCLVANMNTLGMTNNNEVVHPHVYQKLVKFNYFESRPDGIGFPSDQLTNYFAWLTQKKSFYSSVDFMQMLYKSIFRHVANHVESPLKALLKKIIQKDEAFLWFPYDVIDNELIKITDILPGNMVSLHQIVKDDPTKRFSVPRSPVKALSLYYRDLLEYLGRKFYCNTCQAREGMFGVIGLSMQKKQELGLRCDCSAEWIAEIFGESRSFIRKSPSLNDFLQLLQWRLSSESTDDDYYEGDIQTLRSSIFDILTIFNMNIWKCFHVPCSLVPYTADDLISIKDFIQSTPVLPGINGERFTYPCTERRIIAIDDMTIFSCFARDFSVFTSQLGFIDMQNDPSIPDFRVTSFHSSYDIDTFRSDREDFMALNTNEFINAVSNIRPETFFAPTSGLMCLVDFLKIKKLSEFTSTTWHKVETVGHVCDLEKALNDLLFISEIFFYTKDEILWTNLRRGDKLNRIRDMKITHCSSLYRELCFNMEGVHSVRELQSLYHFDLISNPIVLYYTSSFDTHDQRRVLCTMLLSALALDIATLAKNRRDDLLVDLTKLLEKTAKIDSGALLQILEYEGYRALPLSNNESWRRPGPTTVSVVETPVVAEAKDIPMSQLLIDAKNFRPPPKPKGENEKQQQQQQQHNMGMFPSDRSSSSLVFPHTGGPDLEHTADGITHLAQTTDNKLITDRYSTTTTTGLGFTTTVEHGARESFNDQFPPLPPPNSSILRSIITENSSSEITQATDLTTDEVLNRPALDFSHEISRSRAHQYDIDTVTLSEEQNSVIATYLVDISLAERDGSTNGRIGEQIAKLLLTSKISEASVTWVNEESERGQPFDIMLDFENSESRYCEVKTRMVQQKSDRADQWFISPEEIMYANNMGKRYFVLLLTLCVHDGKLCVISGRYVGFQDGFLSALRNKEVKLMVSSKANNY